MSDNNHIVIQTTLLGYRIRIRKGMLLGDTQISMMNYYAPFVETMYDYKNNFTIFINAYRFYDESKELMYIPIYDLPRLEKFLKNNGVTYEIVHLPVSYGKDISIPINPSFPPRTELQSKAINYLVTNKSHIRSLSLQTGMGKAVSVNTNIKVPGGWKLMGDIKVGDTITAWDGTPTKVTGVYPQGDKPLYEVTLSDERSVLVDKEHLWKVNVVDVNNLQDVSVKDEWGITNTEYLKGLVDDINKWKVYIPLIKSEDIPDVDLPIDPYLLGVLIGSSHPRYDRIKITTHNTPVRDKLQGILKTYNLKLKYFIHVKNMYKICGLDGDPDKFVLANKLRDLNIFKLRIEDKFIPDIYLNASHQQRLALLNGIIDIKGSISKTQEIHYFTSSVRLVKDIQTLVRSLGGISNVWSRSFCIKMDSIPKLITYHYVSIGNLNPTEFISSPSKLQRCKHYDSYRTDKLQITSIRKDQAYEECQCIAVDHPDKLYVVKDYIVTHNTYTVIRSLCELNKRAMVCMTSLGEQWIKSILQFTKLTEDDIYYIQGSDSLKTLLDEIDITIFPKIIVANIPTLQVYSNTVGIDEFNNLFKKLDVGIRVLDEAHLRFKTNLIMDLRFNVALTIPVSATLKLTSNIADNIFQHHYDTGNQFGGNTYSKYTKVKVYKYQIPPHILKGRKFCLYMQMYQHMLFEKWVNNNKQVKTRVFENVHMKILNHNYFNNQEMKGFRLLILFSLVSTCEEFYKYLKSIHPTYKIQCVVNNDKIDDVDDSVQIIIATVKKAGTGVDVSNLKVVYNTVSVYSDTNNNQNLGRLRQLKDKSEPLYIYSYCVNVDRQVKHAERRKNLFKKLSNKFEEIFIH